MDSRARAEARELGVEPSEVTPQALRAVTDEQRLRTFYDQRQWQPAWDETSAALLVQALNDAERHGLSKAMFLTSDRAEDPAAREARLTRAALDYASGLARGFTDPKEIREIYTVARPNPDIAAGLNQALAAGTLSEWLGSLAPQTPEYRALSEAFLRYLQQASQERGTGIQSGELIRPGDADLRVPRLVEALAGTGYLDPARLSQPNPQTYTPQVAEAVERVQSDYGLDTDGIVGPDTLEVLNTGPADRARQLAINLERLRWLERDPPPTRIDVNTASAHLDYWRDGQHRDRRRVVVGQPDWETPQLGSPIFRLVANPTWTVPRSIQEDELADKGPGYFAANNMVWKDGWIVQQPGEDNALGQVKLDMQNDYAIYLHDTPAKALFAENERHRSHGCVRVENALQFARVLAEADGILPQFEKAMATGEETFVPLNRKIPVRLVYHTAFFDGSRVQFRTDAYGWDEDVAKALGREVREQRRLRPHERGDFGP